MFKTEFPKGYNFFENIELDVDLGFQGIQNDYKSLKVNIPHKRKRKKKGECNELTNEQKAYNKEMSSQRIDVEHSIGQMKNCRIIHQVVRIKNKKLLDEIVLLSAAIANFKNDINY
jgi:hypothetical protein